MSLSRERSRCLSSRRRWAPRQLCAVWLLLAACHLVAACLGIVGCGPSPLPPTLQVDYAGCAEVLAGPICVPSEERRLWVWVTTSNDADIEILDGAGEVVEAEVESDVEGGQLWTIVLAADVSQLMVRARTASGETSWVLPVAAEPASDVLHPQALAGYRAMAGADFDGAIQHLTRARESYAVANRQLTEVKTAASVVFCQLQQRHLAAVRSTLDSMQLGPEAPAEAHFQKSFYRGYGAVAAGDSRTALVALGEASSWARRLGMQRELGMSEEVLALQMRLLGRSQEAATLFANLRHNDVYGTSPADQARLLNNHAWTLLLAHEGGEDVDDPLPLLEAARRLFDSNGERIDQRVNVRLNLALAYLHAGQAEKADKSLTEAVELGTEPPAHQRLWWLDIAARIALAQGRSEEALGFYDRLQQLAESSFVPDGQWRAAVGRGRTYMAMGKPLQARPALAEAERLLDEQSLLIPLDQGRETFMAQQGESVRLYIDLLLDLGHVDEAFEAARRSRSRLLRTLRYQDRLGQLSAADRQSWELAITDYWRYRGELDDALGDDWQLRVDELAAARRQRLELSSRIAQALDRAFAVLDTASSAPLPSSRPGEVVLAYHPLVNGWVGFAALDGEVTERQMNLPTTPWMVTPEAYAEVLLAPFQETILRAERIRILPLGELREIDFHALPFAGDILLAARPVIYGLDLSTVQGFRAEPSQRALIVADPQGDLQGASREAERVRQALNKDTYSWHVEVLQGGTATADAVVNQLAQVEILHYAGHGVFSGRGGWGSALPLARGSQLTLGDLLALRSSPPWVVLSGCETARGSESGVASLGLAHGFLIAGARQVVATVRPVGDQAAEALFDGFYDGFGEAPDLASRLQQTQLEWRRRGTGDWASFRVLEP